MHIYVEIKLFLNDLKDEADFSFWSIIPVYDESKYFVNIGNFFLPLFPGEYQPVYFLQKKELNMSVCKDIGLLVRIKLPFNEEN